MTDLISRTPYCRTESYFSRQNLVRVHIGSASIMFISTILQDSKFSINLLCIQHQKRRNYFTQTTTTTIGRMHKAVQSLFASKKSSFLIFCFFCLFLFIQKFRIRVIQILVKMKPNAESLVLESMIASVLQERAESTVKVSLLFFLHAYASVFFSRRNYFWYHTSV